MNSEETFTENQNHSLWKYGSIHCLCKREATEVKVEINPRKPALSTGEGAVTGSERPRLESLTCSATDLPGQISLAGQSSP